MKDENKTKKILINELEELRQRITELEKMGDEHKRLVEVLDRRARELTALQTTVLEITAPHDLSILLQKIVERAVSLLNTKSGGMYLCDPDRREVQCVVSYNTPRDYRGTVLKYGEGAAGSVAQTGEPLIIDDYRMWSKRAAIYEKDQPFSAVLSAPMTWQGKVIGVIHVLHEVENRHFTPEDLELLTLFANHAAIAVENTRLYQEVLDEIAESKLTEERLRESENKYKILVDESLQGLVIAQGVPPHPVFVNPTMTKILGYSVDELLTLSTEKIEGLVHPQDRAMFFKNYMDLLEKKSVISRYEVRGIRKDGVVVWLEIYGTRVEYEGQPAVQAAFIDITERKKVEQALRESEEKYHKLSSLLRLMTDTMPDMLWAKNINREFIFVNQAICRNLLNAADTEEPLGKTDMFFATREREAHPENPRWHTFGELYRDSDTITLQEQKPMQFDEFGNVRGEFLYLDVHKAPLYDDDGQLIGVVGSARDITERKWAENLIHTQHNLILALSSAHGLNEGLRLCVDAALRVSEMDCGGVYLVEETSGAFDLIFHKGLSPDFIRTVSHFDVDSDNAKLVIAGNPIYTDYPSLGVLWDEAARNEALRAIAVLPIRHEDRVIGCLNIASHTLNQVPIHSRILVEAIAAQIGSSIYRLKVEESLHKSEQESKQLAKENAIMAEIGRIVSSTPEIDEVYELFAKEVNKLIPFDRIVISMVNLEQGTGVSTYMAGKEVPNRKAGIPYLIEGTGIAEMIRTQSTLLVQTEDIDEVRDRFPQLLSTFEAGLRSIMDVPLFAKGQIIGGLLFRSCQSNAYKVREVQLAERVGNQIAGAVANTQLYMERKKTEEALRESEERFKDIFESAPDGFLLADIETKRFHLANRMICEMLGYSFEEITQLSIRDIHPEKDLPDVIEQFDRLVKGEIIFTKDLPVKRKGGSIFYANIKGCLLILGERTCLLGMFRDITERKRAEEALKTEKQRFQTLSENAPFGMVMIDQDGTFKYINPKFTELFGYDLEDVPNGKTWFRRAFPDPKYRNEIISTWVRDLGSIMPGEKRPRIFAVTCKDEKEKIINFIPVQLETGENLMTFEDITERKASRRGATEE